MIKQVIVVRKDLNMRKGKMCAQVAHASMKVFFDKIDYVKYYPSTDGCNELLINRLTQNEIDWIQGAFTKIVVGCDSEKEIKELEYLCIMRNIPYAVITDNGATEFGGVPTITCIAIGPGEAECIDKLTSNFKLL